MWCGMSRAVPRDMHTTKNDLPKPVRERATVTLNDALATSTHLALQAKQAHWNVKGPSFKALHDLFDEVTLKARSFSDDIAERAAQLGAVVDGTLATVVSKSKLARYSLAYVSGNDHVDALAASMATFAEQARVSIAICEEIGDAVSADLFTEVAREADKLTWMLESHLQADR